MKIRFADINEKNKLKSFWKEAFDEDDIYLDFWFDNIFDHTKAVVAYDGEIQGMAHFYDLDTEQTKSAYICGVAVAENMRNNGIARKMLDFLHTHLQADGYDFCLLNPAISDFYEKFGYFEISPKKDITLKSANPTPYTAYPYDADKMNELYINFCKDFEFTNAHSTKYFNLIHKLYSAYNGGSVIFSDGFAFYSFENDTVDADIIIGGDNVYNELTAYFKGKKIRVKALPVMLKELNKSYTFKNAFISVI